MHIIIVQSDNKCENQIEVNNFNSNNMKFLILILKVLPIYFFFLLSHFILLVTL